VNGHNNKVEIASTVDTLIISGHNNKILAQPGSTTQQIDNMIVTGHNNIFENLLIVGELIVNGHNNKFIGARFAAGIIDQGMNNKFQNCSRVLIQNDNGPQGGHEGVQSQAMGVDDSSSDDQDEEDEEEFEEEYGDEEFETDPRTHHNQGNLCFNSDDKIGTGG